MESMTVEAGYAAGFLATMLEGVKPERRDRGGVFDIEDPEDAALKARRIVIGIPG